MDYKQCQLEKSTPTGKSIQVAWIPAFFAIKNNTIKIENIDGWKIISVGPEIKNDADLIDMRKNLKDHRKITDI